jgi:hypothetical protein
MGGPKGPPIFFGIDRPKGPPIFFAPSFLRPMRPQPSSWRLARRFTLLLVTAALLAAGPAAAQPSADGPPVDLDSTLLAGVRAAAVLTADDHLLVLRPLGVFDLQACLRGWTPCAAPLVANSPGAGPGTGLQVSPPNLRLVFGAVALSAASDGGAVAAWEAGPSCDRRTGTCRQADGDGAAVYLRPLSPDGQAGPLLRLAAATAGDQSRPAVAAGPGGAFVALWQSRGQDGSGWGVYGRRSGPGLEQLGEEFRVTPGTLGDQQAPAVAWSASRGDNSFLTAWQGELGGTAGQGIFVRAFDAEGRPRSRGARIDSGAAAPAFDPALAAVPGGTYVAAWRSQVAPGAFHLFARRLGPTGRPIGPPLRLTAEPGALTAPAVAADETGGFLIAWSAPGSNPLPGRPHQILASYFDAADQPLVQAEALAPRPDQDQLDPVVTSDGHRSYAVVWSISTVIRRAPATAYAALRLTLPDPG